MLAGLISKALTGEAGLYMARMRRIGAIYALIAAFGAATAGFLIAALFILLARNFGALATSLGFAFVCLLVVLGLYVALSVARRPPRQRASDRLQRDMASIASVAAVSNLPLIVASVRRRRSLLLLPVAGMGVWAALRAISAFRNR